MQFRKKPVVIEAEQFFPDTKPWPDGVEQYIESVGGESNTWYGWRINTLEGPHIVKPGDWIITGVQGERYPCKPGIFEATYEATDDTKASNNKTLTREQVRGALLNARSMIKADVTRHTAVAVVEGLNDVERAFAAQWARIEDLMGQSRCELNDLIVAEATERELRADNDALRKAGKRLVAGVDCWTGAGSGPCNCPPCGMDAVLARGEKCKHNISIKEECIDCDRYPCAKCGKLRTKDEGGTTFTVCDTCWDK